MVKSLKLLSTALCAAPLLASAASSETLRLSCLYRGCSPAVLVPFEVNAFATEQIHPACRSIDAHVRAIEYLLVKRGGDPVNAPSAARDIYQTYPWMVMESRNKYFDNLALGGFYYEVGGRPHIMTPKEHAALVEDGLHAICDGLDKN